jgi:hypothetical protein
MASPRPPALGLHLTDTACAQPELQHSYKTAPAQAVVGDELAYVVHVINSAPPTPPRRMVDPIPAGTTLARVCGAVRRAATMASTRSRPAFGHRQRHNGQLADTDAMPCGASVNQGRADDPGLYSGPVTKSASTSLVGTAPPSKLRSASRPQADRSISTSAPIPIDPGDRRNFLRRSTAQRAANKFNSYSTGSGGWACLWTGAPT